MQYDPSPTRGDGRVQNSDIYSEVTHATPFHQYPGLESHGWGATYERASRRCERFVYTFIYQLNNADIPPVFPALRISSAIGLKAVKGEETGLVTRAEHRECLVRSSTLAPAISTSVWRAMVGEQLYSCPI